jgi:hypothetical protein
MVLCTKPSTTQGRKPGVGGIGGVGGQGRGIGGQGEPWDIDSIMEALLAHYNSQLQRAEQQKFLQLKNMKQGSMTVGEYADALDEAFFQVNMDEKSAGVYKMALFLGGLNEEIKSEMQVESNESTVGRVKTLSINARCKTEEEATEQ